MVRELGLSTPKRILDLACGYGRHSNSLAKLGHRVTGVDIIQGFLDKARRDAGGINGNVRYLKGDMREIKFGEEFDAVLLLFTSFGYFNDEDNFKVIENVAKALKPDGFFCFNTLNRDAILKGFLPYIVMEKGNDLMIDRNTFDPITGKLYDKRIVIRNGKRKDKPFFVRLYNPTEIGKLLKRAGLTVYKLYDGWSSDLLTSESRNMMVIAKKII